MGSEDGIGNPTFRRYLAVGRNSGGCSFLSCSRQTVLRASFLLKTSLSAHIQVSSPVSSFFFR
jgi:hypothetical protein